MNSKKLPVRFLARIFESDNRTVLGSTLSKLMQVCGVTDGDPSKLNSDQIKRKMTYLDIPEEEKWRVPLCKELLAVFEGKDAAIEGFTKKECEELLAPACRA